MLYYHCPVCGEPMESPDSIASQEEICPACGTSVTVPPNPSPERHAPPTYEEARKATGARLFSESTLSEPKKPVWRVRPVRAVRTAAAAGSYLSLGCLLPLAMLGAMLASLTILFEEMGWPKWIVWVGFVLFCLRFDAIFYLTYIVGIVAGFFYEGVWRWSLAAIGVALGGYLVWWLLVLFGWLVAPRDEPEPFSDAECKGQA